MPLYRCPRHQQVNDELKLSRPVKSFEVDVTPTSGDPDLYVGANATFPTRETWTWRSTGGAGEALTIDTDGGVACVECDYHFSVYAWSPDVSFSPTAPLVTSAGDCSKASSQ